jgi:hypothetical protein
VKDEKKLIKQLSTQEEQKDGEFDVDEEVIPVGMPVGMQPYPSLGINN